MYSASKIILLTFTVWINNIPVIQKNLQVLGLQSCICKYTNLFLCQQYFIFFIIFFCSTSKNHSTNRDWKTTNLLFFVCILHCLLMTPLIITNLISIELPTEIYAILYAVYLLQYVVNFLIYALGHRQYRKAYVYFLQNVKLSIQ